MDKLIKGQKLINKDNEKIVYTFVRYFNFGFNNAYVEERYDYIHLSDFRTMNKDNMNLVHSQCGECGEYEICNQKTNLCLDCDKTFAIKNKQDNNMNLIHCQCGECKYYNTYKCNDCYVWDYEKGGIYTMFEEKNNQDIVQGQNNDYQMERLLNELTEFTKEKERLMLVATQMRDEYQAKINMYNDEILKKEQYTKDVIYSLIDIEKMKDTKTQKSYQLVSGKITIPKDKYNMKLKEEVDKSTIPDRFIETKKVVKWGDYKKILKIVNGEVINIQTGEIVDNVVIQKEEGGKIKLKL